MTLHCNALPHCPVYTYTNAGFAKIGDFNINLIKAHSDERG